MAMHGRPTQPPPPQQPHEPPPSSPHPPVLDLEITIISAKHLKNVNWKSGILKPYAIFWVDPDHKLTTKSDDSGHTKPVWNQRFLLPITVFPPDSSLSIEIFHSKTSETSKPFVGSTRVSLPDLPDPTNHSLIRTYELLRPSGRPHGKIRLKLAIKERPLPPPPPPPSVPDYRNAPVSSYYYSSAPPYPYGPTPQSAPPTVYPYPMGHYSGYYPPPQPQPPQSTQSMSFSDRYGTPSAPVEYGQSRGGGEFGVGTATGALGGLTLDEGLKHEDGKTAERVEGSSTARDDFRSSTARDDFRDYRGDY